MKNLIEWNDELSVGIQEIDEQHKILVGLVNRLYKAIIQQNDTTVINDIFQELIQYTLIHFSVEESLMRIFNYPEYPEHKARHEELTKQVIELHNKLKKEQIPISMELLSFLRKWLTNHIQMEDKRYKAHFLEKGVKTTWSERGWVGRIWNFVHHH